MKSGLLWYDADPKKPIWDKIDEAAQRYFEKFGVRPNTCFVNPSSLPPEGSAGGAHSVKSTPASKSSSTNSLRVSTKPTILPNHIWLGVSES